MNAIAAICKPELKQEMKKQMSLAWPIILMSMLQYGVLMTSVMVVGHIDELSLSSASIANSIVTVTGSSLLTGMASALDTLCGQAYGARHYHSMGLYLYRALIVLNVTAVPLTVLWVNMEYILLALQQEAAIAKRAGEYICWLIPLLFAYATSQPLVKFLQAQSIVIPLLIISAVTFCCHIPICWLMVYKSGLGCNGAAIATSISNWLYVIMLYMYIRFSPACEKTRIPFTFKALSGMMGFFKVALPSALMICLEWWAYEFLVLLSGLLPDPELETSVLSICYGCSTFAFMIPFALGTAASVRVSNELGAGQPNAARTAVFVSMGIGGMEGMFVFVIFLSLQNVLGRAYSNDEEVITSLAGVVPVLAFSSFLDGIQGVLTGIARGCGWQKAGTYINLVSYYLVGLPVACVLAFVYHVGARGLWLGTTTASVVQLIALVGITWATNWDEEASKAAERVSMSKDTLVLPLLD